MAVTGRSGRRSRIGVAASVATLAWLLAILAPSTAAGGPDPSGSVTPRPQYVNLCAPAGLDTSVTCLRLTLAAVDAARARERVGPMRLPADFPQLSVPEQLFVAVDAERVDRGLAPLVGLTQALDAHVQVAADRARLPSGPGPAYRTSDNEWAGDVSNGLDADYQWMYFDGPGSGLPGCSSAHESGCWIDRHIVLDRFGGVRDLVMGAAVSAGGTSPGDAGSTSLAATLAAPRQPAGPYVYTWAQALVAMQAGTLAPLQGVPANQSDTGIADPASNVAPDYYGRCAPSGIDDSAGCLGAIAADIDRARALEGVGPIVLPTDFAQLSVPEQLFVAINRERVDRGLAPFVGLTGSLNSDAQRGADTSNDPPDPGPAYLIFDGEWAGGSANGLDAVFGWMYDDGFNSGNLECLRRGAPGCWGHRKGILDDFGSGRNLVMGTALDLRGDRTHGDVGGTSMAASLAVESGAIPPLLYTWAQALASTPAGGD